MVKCHPPLTLGDVDAANIARRQCWQLDHFARRLFCHAKLGSCVFVRRDNAILPVMRKADDADVPLRLLDYFALPARELTACDVFELRSFIGEEVEIL